MILDSGLDFACTTDSAQVTSPTNQSAPHFTKFIRYACIGTDSTAPDPSDTLLGSQVGSRSSVNGGFANVVREGTDAGAGVLWYEATFTRTLTISENVNVTEWGLAPAATGNLSVRELFRADPTDNSSSPISLTLESGDELQLVITFRVHADWGYENKSFVITGTEGSDGNGLHTGRSSLATGTSPAGLTVRQALEVIWPGGAGASGGGESIGTFTSDQTSRLLTEDLTSFGAKVQVMPQAYNPGSYYVDWTGTFGTAAGNGDIFAWVLGWPDFGGFGLRFLLVDPAKLTKLATHRLTLTVRKSIARL